ncbi:hypothetical protein MPSEU_000267900 [Mayamaea pseudoterrestris]|nr:hypothetical protein MPSEU_000267900 [Mayamaea pseudoterrestris]
MDGSNLPPSMYHSMPEHQQQQQPLGHDASQETPEQQPSNLYPQMHAGAMGQGQLHMTSPLTSSNAVRSSNHGGTANEPPLALPASHDPNNLAATMQGFPLLMQQYLMQQAQQQMIAAGGFLMQQQHQHAGMAGMPVFMNWGQQAAATVGGDASNSTMAASAGVTDPYADQGYLGPWSANSAGLLGRMGASSVAPYDVVTTKNNKRVRKRPKDRPKRPLSAYNIFFREERQRILLETPNKDQADSGSDINAITKDDEATGTVRQDEKVEAKDISGDSKANISTNVAKADADIDSVADAKESALEKEDDIGEMDRAARKKRPHGKIGFESLAKVIGRRWQELAPDQVKYYKAKADEDMVRYKAESKFGNRCL